MMTIGFMHYNLGGWPNEWLGKVLKFHGASANGVGYRSGKLQGGRFGPHPTHQLKLDDRLTTDDFFHVQKEI